MVSVHLARLIDKVEQGLAQQPDDLAFFPVVPETVSRGHWLTGLLRPVFLAIDRIRESGKLGHDWRDAIAFGSDPSLIQD